MFCNSGGLQHLEYSRTLSFRLSELFSLSLLLLQSSTDRNDSMAVTTKFSFNSDSSHGSPFGSLDK